LVRDLPHVEAKSFGFREMFVTKIWPAPWIGSECACNVSQQLKALIRKRLIHIILNNVIVLHRIPHEFIMLHHDR
jgi:hypothetical protein